MIGEPDAKLAGHERLVTGGGEQVIEAGEQLVARGVVEGQTPPYSGTEGQELRGAKAIGQAGIAGEDDAEQLFGIEVFAGENAQLAEHSGESFLGFVDDEDGAATAGADVVGPASAQGLEARPTIVGGKRHGAEVAEPPDKNHRPALW